MGRFSTGDEGPWGARSQRGMVVWRACGADSRKLSEASLPAPALHLLGCLSQLPDRSAVYEGTLYGFSGGSEGCGYSGRIHVWTSIPGGAGYGAGRDAADSVFAGGLRLV